MPAKINSEISARFARVLSLAPWKVLVPRARARSLEKSRERNECSRRHGGLDRALIVPPRTEPGCLRIAAHAPRVRLAKAPRPLLIERWRSNRRLVLDRRGDSRERERERETGGERERKRERERSASFEEARGCAALWMPPPPGKKSKGT